jgi:hypothetical protein
MEETRKDETRKDETRISIRFPLDVLEVIRALAKKHERSFNGEISWALREYAARHKHESENKSEK